MHFTQNQIDHITGYMRKISIAIDNVKFCRFRKCLPDIERDISVVSVMELPKSSCLVDIPSGTDIIWFCSGTSKIVSIDCAGCNKLDLTIPFQIRLYIDG